MDEPITRRASLLTFGGLVAAVVAGCSRSSSSSAPTAVGCVLSPEQTEGPYYIAGEQVRRDITEGRPGAALTLRTTVVDASSCEPIRDAAVDVWHADAGGAYSGFSQGGGSEDSTFMRGVQMTNADGLAEFLTVYPGWYQGRTVHIHVKVHVGGDVVHTGQLYFDDGLTDSVYTAEPYAARGERDVTNDGDPVFAAGGEDSLLAVEKTGAGYVGTITLGVERA